MSRASVDAAAVAQLVAMALALAAAANALLASRDHEAPPATWITIAASGLPRKTALHLVKTGQIAGKRVGRAYLIDPVSLAAYLRTPDAPAGLDPLAAELGLVVRG